MALDDVSREVTEKAYEAVRLALKEGFEDAAITAYVADTTMAKFFSNRISVVQSWTDIKVVLYLASKGKTYYAEATVSSPEGILELVKSSKRLASLMPRAELYAPLPPPTGKPLEGLFDKSIESRLESVAELADTMISRALEVNSAVKLAGTVEMGVGYRIVVTSSGAQLAEKRSHLKAYARAMIGEDSGHWAFTSTRLEADRVREVGEIAARYAAEAHAAGRASVEPGEYTAILSPLVVGNLFGDLLWMASGLAVLMGFSLFSKYKPGMVVASEKLTVLDEPHDTSLPGSTGFDDEGVATRSKPVIEKGVVKNLLHNSKTAAAMNTETTGNAGYVMPRAWNLAVEPGDAKLEEMIAETRRGLLVLNNWYTRFQNYVEGVFSTVTRDALLYIENGEVKGSISRLRIADTMPNILSRVAMVGKDVYRVEWWETPYPTRAPYIMVEKVRFTRPEA
jgi:PmbA protein